MSTHFLTVNDNERRTSHHRSRSSGYIDDVKDRERRDIRERERQMKHYHDSKFSTPWTSRQRQPSTSDYLGITGSGATIRNAHSTENIGRARGDPSRGYSLKEVQPGPSMYDFDLASDPVRPSPSMAPHVLQTHRHKRPVIKIEIHQNNPPLSNSPAGLTPRRSPSASPHSPTAQPELQYQYATLQNRLKQIGSTCTTYAQVEAASPQDLTFAKIAEQVDGFAFDLHVWAHIVCLNSMAKVDSHKRDIVEAAARNLEGLLCKAGELDGACARAKPKDLKFPGWSKVDEEKMFEEEDDDGGMGDPTESLAFVIHASLRSIELQMRTLKRLSRSLQDAIPDAEEEMIATTKLVQQTAHYFGSQTALIKYSIDPRFTGGRALDEARFAAAG